MNREDYIWSSSELGFLKDNYGNISDIGRLSIGLKKSDYKHLEKFNKFCEYTNTTKM